MSKRESILDDLKDLAVIIIATVILFVAYALWILVTLVIAYWYVVLPVYGYLLYRYLTRPVQPAKPRESTITTHETHKTATGSKIIHTVQKY